MGDRAFRLSILPCVVLGAVLTGASFGAAQTLASELGAADRLAVAGKIHGLVQQYFAHWEGAPRPDVERAHREYIDRAGRAKDRREFDLATLRFIAARRNGHTQFFDDQFDGRPLKFRLLEVEHEWVVIGSQESRLPRGTIVRTVDGKAVGDVVREQAQYVAVSNARLAQTHVFSYPGLFPERISLGLRDGTVVVVDRSVKADAPAPPAPKEPPRVMRSWNGRGRLLTRLGESRILNP
jgi:hypothetical protein